jgi:hypothetical protein
VKNAVHVQGPEKLPASAGQNEALVFSGGRHLHPSTDIFARQLIPDKITGHLHKIHKIHFDFDIDIMDDI